MRNLFKKPQLAFLLLFISLAISACERRLAQSVSPASEAPPTSTIDTLIKTALSEPELLQNIPFPDIIRASSGKEIIPIDPNLPADAELIAVLSEALNRTLQRFNQPDSPTSSEKRINEVSKHFESALQIEINAADGFYCAPPLTRAGKKQRSGYPDLRIVHQETGQVTYLDPKLIASGSIHSSLRSFYYTPKGDTGKVQDDAHHLLVGIEHDGHNGAWKFTDWHLLDLFALKIRLKAEFQASNKDLYQPPLKIIESKKEL